MSGLLVVEHPLVQHHLAALRDAATPPAEFRRLVQRLAVLLAYEATRDLAVAETIVQTPLVETKGLRVSERVGIVPILRAGLGMVDPVLNLLPDAEVWHLGLYRDEATALPVQYYQKLPPGDPVDVAIIVDPMLATGGSVLAALCTLREWGVKKLKVCSLIAAQAGIDALVKEFPEVQTYVCAVDPILNAQKYIVPGLGDAGDRVFNTLSRNK